MKITCPDCSQILELEPEVLAALQGQPHFACPVCEGLMAVPAPNPAASDAQPIGTQKPASTIVKTHRGLNRNLLVLGVVTLVMLGVVAVFLASKNGGNIFNTFQNISNQILHNSYFTQLITNGVTTEKDLEALAEIRPYGDGFIGVSKDPLAWDQAQELARRTGAQILAVDDATIDSREQLLTWLRATFESHLSSTVWVHDQGESSVLAGSEILAVKERGTQRKVLLHWQASISALATADNGWTPLFPNDVLTGWTGDVAGYRLANGILTSTYKGGDLISPKEYGSFQLRFDLRLSSGGNNGIGVWCAKDKGPYKYLAHTGFEIQLLDDLSPTYTTGKPWQSHGALTYFITPKRKPMGAAGTWNNHEIRMEGTKLTVIINDVTVIDQELPTGDPVAQRSRKHRLDLTKKRGHLVFCGMKGPVDFRNVMIKELP